MIPRYVNFDSGPWPFPLASPWVKGWQVPCYFWNARCFSGITFLRNFLEVSPVRAFSGEWFLRKTGGFSGISRKQTDIHILPDKIAMYFIG